MAKIFSLPFIQNCGILLFLDCLISSIAGHVLHEFQGAVGAENYTYYKLTIEGNLKIYLHTLSGDSDIYISDTTLHPTFEDYSLHCATCGEDSVDITPETKRPIGIGIYGHPSHDKSEYALTWSRRLQISILLRRKKICLLRHRL